MESQSTMKVVSSPCTTLITSPPPSEHFYGNFADDTTQYSFTSGYDLCPEIDDCQISILTSDHQVSDKKKNKKPRFTRFRDEIYIRENIKKYKNIQAQHTQQRIVCARALKNENIKMNADLHKYLREEFQVEIQRVMKNSNCFNIQSIDDLLPRDCSVEWITKILEDLGILFYHLSRITTLTDATMAFVTFAKLRTNKSIISNLWIDKLQAYFDSIFDVQSFDEFLTGSRDYLKRFEEVKSSAIFPKLYKFSMYAMSLALFDSVGLTMDNVGYTRIEQQRMKKKYTMGVDFFHTMADTLLFLCERGYQMMITGSIEPIFHSPKTYVKWFDRTNLLKRQATVLNDPESHGFTIFGFITELDELIEQGESIYKHAVRVGKAERTAVRTIVNELHMLKCELMTKRKARESRLPPFPVLVCGDSGIGKSTIKDMLFYHYGKKKGLPLDSSFCYTRNPVAKFWDGFTTAQWAVILDDVAFMNPNAAPGGDPSCMEFIQIINAVPFVPDQASLTDKGRTPLRCKLCIATTNTEHLNAYYYFSCPSAAQRRFPYIIIPTVLECYRGEGGMLDSSKVPDTTGYPDLWSWSIKKVVAVPVGKKGRPELVVTHENLNLVEFLQWYNEAIDAHDRNQSKVSSSISQLRDTKLCLSCFLPIKMCVCVQSNDINTFLKRWLIWSVVIHVGSILITHFAEWYYRFRLWRFFRCKLKQFKHDQSIFWTTLGKRVQSNIGHPKFLIGLVGVLATGSAIYKLTSRTFAVQGAAQTKPKPDDHGEKENVWYKNTYTLSPLDLSPQILSMKGLTLIDFLNQFAKNCYSLTSVRGDNISRPGKAVCLKGQIYLACNHTVPEFEDSLKMIFTSQCNKDGVSKNIEVLVSSAQVTRYPERDLVVLIIPNLPPGRDISNYFAKEDFDAKFNGHYCIRERDGSMTTLNVDRLRLNKSFPVPQINATLPIWFGVPVTRETVNGDCGAPLVMNTTMGNCIVGIHTLGSTGHCGANRVSQEFVKRVISENPNYSVQSGYCAINAPSTNRVMGDLHKKSVFRYITEGAAGVAGSFVGFRMGHKSRVEKTLMSDHFVRLGYPIKTTAPEMSSYKSWRIAALEMVKPVTLMNQNILDVCGQDYLDTLIEGLSPKDLQTLEIYDDFTAINGSPGVSYVDSVSRNTSSGNPWKKSKKYFLTAIAAQHGCSDPVAVDEEIMSRVRTMEQSSREGIRCHPNFCAHLKDEPVSFAKKAEGKTRVFAGAPFDFTILMRKYYLSFVRLAQNNKILFEAAPGAVAQSCEWGDFYDHLTYHGKNQIVAGDYKAFDKKMPPAIILKAFEIIAELCKLSGNFDKEDLIVLRTIAYDVAFPTMDFNGDLVQFFGSNPSGHPLTVTINSLVNSLYVRYCYLVQNPKQEILSFRMNVKLLTYGDDNIMGVSKAIPWFNHTTIQKALADIGVGYTMAEKTAESVPYISIEEASFLKRTWVFDKDIDAYLCPLDHASIDKMLTMWVSSKTISQEEQAIAYVKCDQRVLFLWKKGIQCETQDVSASC